MRRGIRTIFCFALVFSILCPISLGAFAAGYVDLVLVGNLPKHAEMVENLSDAEGNYWEVLSAEDGAIMLTTMRRRVDREHPLDMELTEFLSEYFAEIRDMKALQIDPIAGYPAERGRFETGQNEDSQVVEAVLIRTDRFHFAFLAETSADMYYGYTDPYGEGEIPEMIDMWVESLDLFSAGAPAAGTCFGMWDIQAACIADMEALEDFVSAFSPTYFNWNFLGEATGETALTLHCEYGALTLYLIGVEDILNPDEGDAGLAELPREVLSVSAKIRGIHWAEAGFPIEPPRGVQIGAPKETVLNAYLALGEEVLYTASDINPMVDDTWHIGPDFIGGRVVGPEPEGDYESRIEYSWCPLDDPDAWREYYFLDYYILEGKVAGIRLSYSTDPE